MGLLREARPCEKNWVLIGGYLMEMGIVIVARWQGIGGYREGGRLSLFPECLCRRSTLDATARGVWEAIVRVARGVLGRPRWECFVAVEEIIKVIN